MSAADKHIKEIRQGLFALKDEKYKEFQKKLIPTVDENTVIGVRTPVLRKYAKDVSGTPGAVIFMQTLPHEYYEENNLHGMLIETMKDYDECIAYLDEFLPYVDNWATCDLISPRVFKKHKDELLVKIKEWMASDRVYTIRFGMEMLMTHFLDEDFKPEYLGMAADVHSEEYYVNMMIAWFFATALAKQYEASLPYIENHCMDRWTHNKTIQKAIESYRITDEQKRYLKSLKIK
ncbi:putative DNA alkylation repair enzyme [Firmicutes bacterium CAG:238]|nr:putative DNA alkylation repair enzyme [Firmicutes bacterium CAG:238]